MKINQGRLKKNKRHKEPFRKRAGRFLAKSFKYMLLAALAPSIAYSGWVGYKRLITTPYLAIKTINVNGAEKVSMEEVAGLSGLEPGQNLLSFRKKDVIEAIRKNPWVREASIKRGMPDTVTIDIKERRPLALVQMDGLYVMDTDGVVFKKLSIDDELDLPVVTGLKKEGIKDGGGGLGDKVLELIRGLNARSGFNLAKVSEIHVDPVFGLSVYTLEDGIRLDMGTDGFERKIAMFERVLRSRDGALRGIEAMDLNGNREVIVRFTTNVVKEGGDRHGQKG